MTARRKLQARGGRHEAVENEEREVCSQSKRDLWAGPERLSGPINAAGLGIGKISPSEEELIAQTRLSRRRVKCRGAAMGAPVAASPAHVWNALTGRMSSLGSV